MNKTEEIVRKWHESWDLRDPDRGTTVIAEACQFEDVARNEAQIEPRPTRMITIAGGRLSLTENARS